MGNVHIRAMERTEEYIFRVNTSVLLPGPEGNASRGRIENTLPAIAGNTSSSMSWTEALNLHISWLSNTRTPTISFGCHQDSIMKSSTNSRWRYEAIKPPTSIQADYSIKKDQSSNELQKKPPRLMYCIFHMC